MLNKNRDIEKVQENMITDIIHLLKKEGYYVKKDLKYPGYGKIKNRFTSQNLDIFAYKGINNIICVNFQNCSDILSRENEIKWRSLIAKPGLNLHLIVPPRCREKACLKSKMKNIPVEIHDYNNWKNTFDLSTMKFSK